MDSVNRETWREHDTVALFAGLSGWTDPGERAAIDFVAPAVEGQPILDLGVGGGRTVPLLRELSEDYVALDYTPELAEVCRRRYPDVRVVDGDARDLSRFPDGSFKLVVFSFNGIDAVGPDDRLTILREVRRVLREDGLFVFSVHNRKGPGHGERLSLGVYPTRNPFKLAGRFFRALGHLGRTLQNRARYAKLNEESDDFSIMNASAHDHGLLVHYISVEAQRRQLEEVGFSPSPVVYGNLDDVPLSPDADTSAIWWFHFVVRR